MRLMSIVLGLVLVLTACSAADPESEDLTVAPTESVPAEVEDDPADTVTFEASYGGVPLTVAVHPVEQVGETALVTIDWTLGATAPKDWPVSLSILMRNVGTTANLGQLRLVDLERGWVASPGTSGSQVATTSFVTVRAGETVSSEAVFAAPPGDVVDLLVPSLGLVEGVPVQRGDGAAPEPAELEIPEGVTYPAATLESFTAAYDEGSTASVEGDEAVVTLASDVLFAFDEFALTAQAAATVDDAAAQIGEAAQAGEVTVVGHTDDEGAADYNLELSRKRADSVAERLGSALGEGFTVVAEGKGKSEPAVDGTSAEARAANRRVEVRFITRTPGAAVGAAASPVPEAEGVVGSGHEPVIVEVNGAEHEVTVRRVERRGGYLVGTLESVGGAPSSEPRLPFMVSELGPQRSRGFGSVSSAASAMGVALAGEGGWVYPVDYRVSAPEEVVRREVLADRLIHVPFGEKSRPTTVTVLWPDTGQDKVAVDVQGRFRITDVLVEESS